MRHLATTHSSRFNLNCVWWLTLIALWEAKIGRIRVPAQHRQKIRETPSHPIAGYGGVYLSSWLCRRLSSGGLCFKVSPGKKIHETPLLNRKSLAWLHMSVNPAMARSINRKIMVQAYQAKSEILPPK
jgi:aspartyl aminopeptidase